MKFATGPATTMAARFDTGWKKKLRAPIVRTHRLEARRIGNAAGVLVAEEFHVAAQRNGGDFPPRAVAIVKADEFGAETDGKHQNPHAAQARNQKVPEFVEKHHKAENEQKRDEVADNAAPQRM